MIVVNLAVTISLVLKEIKCNFVCLKKILKKLMILNIVGRSSPLGKQGVFVIQEMSEVSDVRRISRRNKGIPPKKLDDFDTTDGMEAAK